MKYKIIIQKISPPREENENYDRFLMEEVVFEAFVNEEEVIELMKVGYYLKERAEKLATKNK